MGKADFGSIYLGARRYDSDASGKRSLETLEKEQRPQRILREWTLRCSKSGSKECTRAVRLLKKGGQIKKPDHLTRT